jgi:hypothetical protein
LRAPLSIRRAARAYAARTQHDIERYLGAAQNESQQVQTVLEFALLCVLESVSYTRKDGQYLRWDHRSGRRHGKVAFEKGPIVGLSEAIIERSMWTIVPVDGCGNFTYNAREVEFGGQKQAYGSGGNCMHREARSARPPGVRH